MREFANTRPAHDIAKQYAAAIQQQAQAVSQAAAQAQAVSQATSAGCVHKKSSSSAAKKQKLASNIMHLMVAKQPRTMLVSRK